MIFISYSHKDAEWCQELLTMAAPLARFGGLHTFSDSDITSGANWRSTIQKSLDKSVVAVLLVSRYFLESKFVMDVELPYILKARDEHRVALLWVLVSECLYEDTPLGEIEAALHIKSPLEAMRKADLSAALKTVSERIKAEWMAAEQPKLNMALEAKRSSSEWRT